MLDEILVCLDILHSSYCLTLTRCIGEWAECSQAFSRPLTVTTCGAAVLMPARLPACPYAACWFPGLLCITYMGTDPPLNVVGGFEGKELNYEEMDEEHRRLLGIIREATSENKAEPSDKVVLRAQVRGEQRPPPPQRDARTQCGNRSDR